MCRNIGELPIELHVMVLERASRDTLKHMCIVNKYWRKLAKPLLWVTFVSDLSSTSKRDLNVILTHKPGGVFTLVRNLYVRKPASLSQDAWNLKFSQLISVIERHTLVKVVVNDAIDRETLGMLIMQQNNLQELSVPIIDKQVPPGSEFVNGKLASLKKLTILPNADQAGYDAWLENTTALEELIVWSKRTSGVSLFVPWTTTSKLKNLKNLYLHGVKLQFGAGRIEDWTDIVGLSRLTIRDCKGIADFLDDLRLFYYSRPFAQDYRPLNYLAISEIDDEHWMYYLDELVYVVDGLEYIYLSSSCYQLPEPNALGAHHRQLSVLLMDPQNDWEEAEATAEITSEDLVRIGSDGKFIEELGVSLVHVNFDEWEVTERWYSDRGAESSDTTALVRQLDAIATFPKLRILRLTQAPIKLVAQDGTDPRIGPVYQRQWRYQQFAKQILRRLALKGSKVQLLAFSPSISHKDDVAVLEDGNGHIWPHYKPLSVRERLLK